MTIQRGFTQHQYTVARFTKIVSEGIDRTDIEYKRGIGKIIPDDTQNNTTVDEVGETDAILLGVVTYTKQDFPLVADVVQGYKSDYFMWTDTGQTSRWHQAIGWRDFAHNGKDSYQKIAGQYDSIDLDLDNLAREQELVFCEIDDMVKATSSTKRVISMKMECIDLPDYVEPLTNLVRENERYMYYLDGDSGRFDYNSLDTTNPSTTIQLKRGNKVEIKYQANTPVGNTGETTISRVGDKYITTRMQQIDISGQVTERVRFKFKVPVGTPDSTLLSGNYEWVNPFDQSVVNTRMYLRLRSDGRVTLQTSYTTPTPPVDGVVNPPLVYISSNTINYEEFNTIEVSWPHDQSGTVPIRVILNGVSSDMGWFDPDVGGFLSAAPLFRLRSLGCIDEVYEPFTPVVDFDGVIKEYQRATSYELGDQEPEDVWVNHPINESTGSVVVNTLLGGDGARVNMTDADITVFPFSEHTLFSGSDVSPASPSADLTFNQDLMLYAANPEWIEWIKYDGVLIDLNTFVAPNDDQFHHIEVECAQDCEIKRLGTDQTTSKFYSGFLYDFAVTRGKKRTLWELNTRGSMKHNPKTLTDLAFGLNPQFYTDRNWKLKNIGNL